MGRPRLSSPGGSGRCFTITREAIMSWTVLPGTISGEMRVPGDKSIAHRALMLAALAGGRSTLRNVSFGGDVRATASSLGQLGVRLYGSSPEEVVVEGTTFAASNQPVDCANSGTTMRLMAGVLAAHPFSTTLVGDASLSRRPMNRVIEPLRKMGGDLYADGGH